MLSIFFRKKRAGVNSIETVFNSINKLLVDHVDIILPLEGASPKVLLKNIIYSYQHSGKINHVSGDVHYAVLGTGYRSLLTIHDVGSAFTGGWLKRFYVKLFWFWLPTLIAKRISVISDVTYKDVLILCPWVKKKISVIPDPYNISFEGSEKIDINKRPRILHIGTKVNKNLERTIEALTGFECELIIIGKLTNNQITKLNDSGLIYKNKYDIPLEELTNEYRKCDIVSFPSTFEGFGMPIIEAQAAMRPVLAGDISVLRNVAGNEGALFVNPYDVNSIKQGFSRLINDNILRKKLVETGRNNIKRFHPSHIAKMYNNLYNEL